MRDPPEDSDGTTAHRILAVALYALFLTLGAIYTIASRGEQVTIERVFYALLCSFN